MTVRMHRVDTELHRRPHVVVYLGLRDRAGLDAAIAAQHDPRSSVFGRSISNGCIRMPKAAQKDLLAHIHAGTPVVVID